MISVKHETKGMVSHGTSACQGCAMEIIMRNVLDVLGEDTILVIPPGCSAIFCGYNNETCVKVPTFQGNLENTAAYAAGISRGLRKQGNDHTVVVGFAGDGGTLDIGLQSLSGMIERGDDVLYICYDNEAYMNTGIQGSSSTPFGCWTTTTPAGKPVNKKDLLGIAAAHHIPYCASANPAYLPDLRKKIQKAKDIKGPRLLHIFSPCPTGWRSPSSKSIEIARNAVLTGAWALYEYENGKYTINMKLKELKPIQDYLANQRRFRAMKEDEIAKLQQFVQDSYDELLAKAE